MPRIKALLTVTTYPLPSRSYDELVCTAGILEDGSWIRIYPIPLSFLRNLKINGVIQNTKYTWIELDLHKRNDDFRPESYSPKDYKFKDLKIFGHLDTKRHWAERKIICLKDVYIDFEKLIKDSNAPLNKSLATFKPTKILDFIIKHTDREWKDTWKAQFQQSQINFDNPENTKSKEPPLKVPYEFSYKFTEENGKVHTLMIEDWEIGELYWSCLRAHNNDEHLACMDVRNKYFNEFVGSCDVYLFLGTTKTNHIKRARNPFVIIGVFYPKKNPQLSIW